MAHGHEKRPDFPCHGSTVPILRSSKVTGRGRHAKGSLHFLKFKFDVRTWKQGKGKEEGWDFGRSHSSLNYSKLSFPNERRQSINNSISNRVSDLAVIDDRALEKKPSTCEGLIALDWKSVVI